MLIKQAPENSNKSKQQHSANDKKKSEKGNDKGKSWEIWLYKKFQISVLKLSLETLNSRLLKILSTDTVNKALTFSAYSLPMWNSKCLNFLSKIFRLQCKYQLAKEELWMWTDTKQTWGYTNFQINVKKKTITGCHLHLQIRKLFWKLWWRCREVSSLKRGMQLCKWVQPSKDLFDNLCQMLLPSHPVIFISGDPA